MHYWLNRFVIFDFIDQLETLSEETQFLGNFHHWAAGWLEIIFFSKVER